MAKNNFRILAIETSCDETAVAVLECDKSKNNFEMRVISNIVASQIEIHKKWGGIYPEMASRAHLESLIPAIRESLTPFLGVKSEKLKVKSGDRKTLIHNGRTIPSHWRSPTSLIIQNFIDAIAVTTGPGLIGSLLMGVEAVQILAAYFDRPVISVNHLEGHIYSAFSAVNQKLKIKNQNDNVKFKIPKAGIFPILALIVSGGHTSLVLMRDHLKYETVGQTVDDAAGEAFDKVARILDLGYPGGPEVEKAAKSGNEKAYNLPMAMVGRDNLDFSFSGLKTAVLYLTKDVKSGRAKKFNKVDLAASFQKTVAEILTQKTIRAIKRYKPKTVILAGGVSANQYLRDHFAPAISNLQLSTFNFQPNFLAPPKNLSTDNALGIAIAGAVKFSQNKTFHWSKIEADASSVL